MITIVKHGTTVKVDFETGLVDSSSVIFFYWECNSQVFAELLASKLSDHLCKRVAAIRREEYERGWKHAKAKKPKENWFSSTFRLIWNK